MLNLNVGIKKEKFLRWEVITWRMINRITAPLLFSIRRFVGFMLSQVRDAAKVR